MKVTVVTDLAAWDAWLLNVPGVAFTQAAAWVTILRAEGKAVELLAVEADGKIVAQTLAVYSRAWWWQYAFSPSGPVILEQAEAVYKTLRTYFKTKKCLFWRFEPSFAEAMDGKPTFDITPRATSVVDIAQTEDVLLAAMHSKTRYNIQLAEKKGVTISEEKNFPAFWRLLQQTAERDGFRLHEKKHYEAIFASPETRQVTALVEGKPVATALYIGFGDTFTYVFAASNYDYRQYMAPYAIHWYGFRLAKRLRSRRYDFYGIAPANAGEGHQYAGVTRFKVRFGGARVERPGTFDLITSSWQYVLYNWLRQIRRLV